MQHKIRALILGGGPYTALAVAKALQDTGDQAVLGIGSPAMAAATRSRSCRDFVHHPPIENPLALRDFLAAYLTRGDVSVVLPVADNVLAALAPWRGELEPLAPWAAPPLDCTSIALDKNRTIAAATLVEDALRPPVTIEPDGPQQLPAAWRGGYPVVVKPRTGSGAEGVYCATDPEELARIYGAVHATYPRPLVQELIPYRRGEKFLLFNLFDAEGGLRSWYMHRTLVEQHTMRRGINGARMPGGINLVWESYLDTQLLERGRRLLEALGWRGYGFIECVRDQRSGEPRLIEINPRFAGTIALPLQQGVNFAHDACLVALGLAPAQQLDYRTGLRGKRDVVTMLSARQPRALAALLDPCYAPPVSSWRDPAPLAHEVMRLLGKRLGRSIGDQDGPG